MSQILKPKKGYKRVKWLFGKEIEIPVDWDIKKIKDFTKVSVGLVINPSTYFDDNGSIPMITGKHVTENGIVLDGVDFITEKSNKLLETTRIWSGDLVTMRVGYPGRTSVVKNEHNGINCASVIITRRSKNFVSDFLGYLVNSKLISKQILMHQAGGAQQVVNVGSWKEFLILFPPITEQEKIATILSHVDNLISDTQKIINQTQYIKKGLMQKLFTKGIGHDKFKKIRGLFGKEIEIPEKWKQITIGETCNVTKLAGFEYTIHIKFESTGDIPIVKAQNVKMNGFSFDKIEYISKEVSDRLPRSQIHGNEVLMVFIGANIGNVCLSPGKNWHLGPNVAKITPKKFNTQFLNYFLQSSEGQKNILKWAKSTTIPNLSMETIRKIIVLLPPILEQQKIASILSNIDSQIQSQIQYKEKLERLKKSLMQKLLTGEVRVKV